MQSFRPLLRHAKEQSSDPLSDTLLAATRYARQPSPYAARMVHDELIVQRENRLTRSLIPLTAAAAEQLPIDPVRVVSFGRDYMQPSALRNFGG